MSSILLTHGMRYRARIELGFLERLASDEKIRDLLETHGFTDVSVTQESASKRMAEGTWARPTEMKLLPSQVVAVIPL